MSSTTEVVGDSPNILILVGFGFYIAGAIVVILVNNALNFASLTRFYTSTPATSAIVLAEVLITVSLCVLLYDGGSRSTAPRTKRLLNTLIVYAVNRCLLTLLVTVAEVSVLADPAQPASWTMALECIVGKLYANSLLASLNTREYLRSRDSSFQSDPPMNTMCFADAPKLSGDMRTPRVGVRGFHECEAAVRVDVTTEPAFDKTTTLRREAEE
ncbi:hypothetical protein EDD16DRAFT_184478 [Pisolithus croceorrhizus]|nr:hypothetical protein EDD16DRAFT_184478 [Pisolithus croceorrhizus]